MDPVVHGPGEGGHHPLGPSKLLIKATAADTSGSFFLSRAQVR